MATTRKKSIELLEPILADTFGLERLFKPTVLMEEWLSASGTLNERDTSFIAESLEKLIENADSWNEEELKMKFPFDNSKSGGDYALGIATYR